MIEVLSPVYGEPVAAFDPALRLPSLAGATVGIISNGKHGTVPFFDALSDALRDRHGVLEVERIVKPNYSAPAGDAIFDRTARWNALISGIGD